MKEDPDKLASKLIFIATRTSRLQIKVHFCRNERSELCGGVNVRVFVGANAWTLVNDTNDVRTIAFRIDEFRQTGTERGPASPGRRDCRCDRVSCNMGMVHH